MDVRTASSPLYRTIVEALITTRKAAGVRQVELASRLGKPQSFVSKYENGERQLDVAEFVVIAQALDADPVMLLSRCIEGSATSCT